MSQFALLQGERAAVFESAVRAETAALADPRTACFYARRALDLAVSWAYKHDASLKLSYWDNLSALIHDPSFKEAAGEAAFSKARVINTLGNRAEHGASRDTARRRDGRGAPAVPRHVLARPNLRSRGATGARPGLRRECVAEGDIGARTALIASSASAR